MILHDQLYPFQSKKLICFSVDMHALKITLRIWSLVPYSFFIALASDYYSICIWFEFPFPVDTLAKADKINVQINLRKDTIVDIFYYTVLLLLLTQILCLFSEQYESFS